MAPSKVVEILESGSTDHPAIVVPDGPSLTYGELRNRCDEAVLALQAAGVRQGDRVAMVYPNTAEAIVLFLAVSSIAVACPLNPAYKEDEFRFYLEDTGARFLIVPPGQAPEARRALPAGATVIEAKIDAGRLQMTHDGGGAAQPVSGPDDVALVLHTSGTTSRPKRVPLRHRNLTASIANIVRSYALSPEDVSLCVMPLFHVHGLMASALATLASGGTVVVPEKFNPMAFWPLMQATKPTWFTASPTPHSLILSRLRDNRPPGSERLRFVRSCSAALSPAQMALMEERLGAPVLEAYGMTEASHQMASNPLPPTPSGTSAWHRVGSDRGTRRCEIADASTARSASAAPNVIDGYENNPEANAIVVHERLVSHRRPGHAGRRRLPAPARADQGDDQPRRREDRASRDRRGPRVTSGRRRGGGFGIPHPTWGEEVAAAVVLSAPATREGAARVLPAAPGRLQGAAAALHRRVDSQGADRQDPAPMLAGQLGAA